MIRGVAKKMESEPPMMHKAISPPPVPEDEDPAKENDVQKLVKEV